MKVIKEIFIHLQSKSDRYPLLDHQTVMEHFIKKLNIQLRSIDITMFE